MTLTDAKAYLMQRRCATLGDIAVDFESSPDAARHVMQHWVAKGRVTRIACAACKTGCACANRPAAASAFFSQIGTA